MLHQSLRLPVIGAPMFLVSSPRLVLAQCAAGILGTLPSLNARPQEQLGAWLAEISRGLATIQAEQGRDNPIPWGVNLIIHASNDRVEADLETCSRFRVPLIITSLRAPGHIVQAVHDWGGLIFHDVTTLRHAEKALEAGVDGLILVCAGAGGHGGILSPFALLGEVRRIFDGPIALAGAISRGQDIAAARAMGADFVTMGTRFIASEEAQVDPAYKQMILESAAQDILYTPAFSGIPANYLKASIRRAGLDPDTLPTTGGKADFGEARVRPWKDILGAGQGVGNIQSVGTVADIVDRLEQEYREGCNRVSLG